MKQFFYSLLALVFLGDYVSGQEPNRIAERIWFNGNILTCDSDFRVASAFAVREGIVMKVGDREDLLPFANDQTEWIDLDGSTVTPGFCDSHMHFVGLGISLQRLDLRTAESWDEIIDAVADKASTLPIGTWILGNGWH